MNRPWLRAQVRRRAAEIIGPDYPNLTYIECVLDGLEADDVTDVRQISTAELDQRVTEQSLPPAADDDQDDWHPTPVFTRTDVPGIGRIDVYPGGRIRLDGDLDLDRHDLTNLVAALDAAVTAARAHDTRPLRRPADVGDTLAALADRNG